MEDVLTSSLDSEMNKCPASDTSSSEENEHPSSLGETELKECCGIMGCVLNNDVSWDEVNVAQTVFLGLIALQHRGQEGSGIVVSDGGKDFQEHKGLGLVHSILKDDVLSKFKGSMALGHNRYSTAGGKSLINIQPFVVHTRHGSIAVAHNGQLINANALRNTVLDRGVGLSTYSDSELITQILCLTPPRGEKDGPNMAARIRHLMEATPLAYSLALMFQDKLYGARDPFGNRPLCIGKLIPTDGNKLDPDQKALGWILSSESCTFQSIGAVFYKEVLPGEIIELSSRGVRTLDVVPRPKNASLPSSNNTELIGSLRVEEPPPAFCIFEYVYFARSDSFFEGQQVYKVRQQCGRQLAKETSVEADIVSSIPESATPSAHGYALESGIPFVEVLCKNRYVGRSFILPDTRSRQLAVAMKFGAIEENLVGKRVILVDDSIVRGNTVGPIIKLLRNAGAKEVHIRIASPPIKHPCYMGINIPTKSELIANKKEAEELAEFVGADSLKYLSIKGLETAVKQNLKVPPQQAVGHCTACLDSNYPCSIDW